MFVDRDRFVLVRGAGAGSPPTNSVAFCAAATAPLIALLLARSPLVLPTISLVALAGAALIALAAWWTSSDPNSSAISLWDVCGAYAFIGFAAGALSDPNELVEFFASPAAVSEQAR
jgi:hypothetical protein